MKKRFSEEQMTDFLVHVEAGMAISEVFRQDDYSDATCYNWQMKFGGMSATETKRLRELDAENAELEHQEAESILGAKTQGSIKMKPLSHPQKRGAVIVTREAIAMYERRAWNLVGLSYTLPHCASTVQLEIEQLVEMTCDRRDVPPELSST